MDNSLTIGIICLVAAFFSRTGKIMSEDLMKKISQSDEWPLDDCKIATFGLGYAHKMRLSRDDVLKRTKSNIVVASFLSWIFFGAASFFGIIWLL